MIKRLGYIARSAADGNAATELVEAGKVRIDLLLTDIIMPEMSGVELFDKLSGKIPGLKVLYMSGYPAKLLSDHKISLGQSAFVPKPFSVTDLRDGIRRAMTIVDHPSTEAALR